MEHDPRIKLDIYKHPTTYGNDYCKFKPDARILHTWPMDRAEPPLKQLRQVEKKDLETFYKYHKGCYIPYDLLLHSRSIVKCNPSDNMQDSLGEGKEEIAKTRARSYLSPAINMDDISESEIKNQICNYVYISDWKIAASEAAQPVTTRHTSDTVSESETGKDLVGLKTVLYDSLPPGCSEKARSWDYFQNRACVDPSFTFWANKDPAVKCGACINPYKGLVKQEIKNEIADLVKKNKLSLPHDIATPSYTGYMPKLSRGVSLAKKDMPVSHPFVTTQEAILGKYETANK